MIERTKVMDQIYLTHKLKLADLMRGIEEYKLEEDADVKDEIRDLGIAHHLKRIKSVPRLKEDLKSIKQLLNAINERGLSDVSWIEPFSGKGG